MSALNIPPSGLRKMPTTMTWSCLLLAITGMQVWRSSISQLSENFYEIHFWFSFSVSAKRQISENIAEMM
jgi:hypothetical protein